MLESSTLAIKRRVRVWSEESELHIEGRWVPEKAERANKESLPGRSFLCCKALKIGKIDGTSAKFSPRQQQVQNFPQIFLFKLIYFCFNLMVAGSNLSWQGIERKVVYTEGAGPVCKCTGQCTLEGT